MCGIAKSPHKSKINDRRERVKAEKKNVVALAFFFTFPFTSRASAQAKLKNDLLKTKVHFIFTLLDFFFCVSFFRSSPRK